MNGQTVAILESRLGVQLAELIAKRGGKPFHAPALAEIADVDPDFIRRLIEEWQKNPVKAAVFQTGVGTQALFKTTDALGLTPTVLALLDATTVVVRGPKPTAAVRARGVRIDLSANDPFTTAEVIKELATLSLKGECVVVQRYGAKNPELEQQLQAWGASVVEIPTYRWSLPADTEPMKKLLTALERKEIDALVVTSASQILNLYELATSLGQAPALTRNLNTILMVSIGPVASATIKRCGVKVGLEAHPPKLGPLMSALDETLSRL